MKHSHRPFCRSGSVHRMEPAVHPGWKQAVPTRMEMTRTIQPAAPTLAGNWCHLFTPLSEMAFSNTTDTVFGWETHRARRLRGKGFSNTTDTVFGWDARPVGRLGAMSFLPITDTVFRQGTRSVSPPEARSVLPVDAGAFWPGRGGEKRCPYPLKAGRALMGCISHTSFLEEEQVAWMGYVLRTGRAGSSIFFVFFSSRKP